MHITMSISIALLVVVVAQRVVSTDAFMTGTAALSGKTREPDAALFIRPGFDEHAKHWVDSQGNRIEAHGAGMVKSPDDGRWYWYGESRKGELQNPGVNCYSAASLAGPWEPHGRVFGSSDIKLDGWSAPFIVERPKVIYNTKTKKYVMWAHVDHFRSPEKLMSEMSPETAKRVCDEYLRTTTCSWTSAWNCPAQRPGTRGPAGADDSLGYKCCCDMKLWMKLSKEECAPYKAADRCKWTAKYSCPGQPAGTSGPARDDQSTEYQCCCDHGMWNKAAPAATSFIQVAKETSNKSASVLHVRKKKVHRRLLTASAMEAIDSQVAPAQKLSISMYAKKAHKSNKVGRKRRHVLGHQRARKLASNRTLETPHRVAAEYVLRRVAVATSDKPAGPFKLEHIFTPDDVPSLDLNLWVDKDGSAYFIRSCDNAYTGISRLTDDYLSTTGMLSKGPMVEGMALFRHWNGTLYMMASHLTGWNPNPLILFRSDGPSLEDPKWVEIGNPTQDPTSFNTQPTTVVQYTTKSGMTYSIYMADNWVYGGRLGLLDATYVWLPIRFDKDGGVHLDRRESWNLEDPFAR